MSSAESLPGDPSVLVVMGVSGSGKSTIAEMLARRLHWIYEDADWLHPQANVEKMARGVPLTDDDRRPWLQAVAARIDAFRTEGRRAVVACSALKRAYRDILIGERRDVRLVFLKGMREVVAQRLAGREGHFMQPSLLDSQFAVLEEPRADERPIVISIDAEPRRIVEAIVEEIARAQPRIDERRD
jgi:gluconokinase